MRPFLCVAAGCEHASSYARKTLLGAEVWSCRHCGHVTATRTEAARYDHPSPWFLVTCWVVLVAAGSGLVWWGAAWGLR